MRYHLHIYMYNKKLSRKHPTKIRQKAIFFPVIKCFVCFSQRNTWPATHADHPIHSSRKTRGFSSYSARPVVHAVLSLALNQDSRLLRAKELPYEPRQLDYNLSPTDRFFRSFILIQWFLPWMEFCQIKLHARVCRQCLDKNTFKRWNILNSVYIYVYIIL